MRLFLDIAAALGALLAVIIGLFGFVPGLISANSTIAVLAGLVLAVTIVAFVVAVSIHLYRKYSA